MHPVKRQMTVHCVCDTKLSTITHHPNSGQMERVKWIRRKEQTEEETFRFASKLKGAKQSGEQVKRILC